MSVSNHYGDYPWAYTQGYVDFYGYRLRSDERALIPRLESECLIRKARATITYSAADEAIHIIDVGCGSGVLGLTLAATVRMTHALTTLSLLDISIDATSLARENTHLLSLESITSCSCTSLLDGYESSHLDHTKTLIILANLPYIRQDERDLLSVDTQYEPSIALFGTQDDGLGLYRELMTQVAQLHRLYPHLDIHLFFEYGHSQRQDLMRDFAHLPYEHFADYRGIGRFTRFDFSPMTSLDFTNIDLTQIWKNESSRNALIFHTIYKTISGFAPEIHPKSVKIEGSLAVIRLKSPVEIMIVREHQYLLMESLSTLYTKYQSPTKAPTTFLYR